MQICTRVQSDEDAPGMSGVTDLVERVDQCILFMRLESNVQVDGCAGRGMALAFPLGGDGVPRVFHSHVVPMWGGGSGEAKRG
jgi:hypothetical protein